MSVPQVPKRICSHGHVFSSRGPCPRCWPGYRTFRTRAKVWLYPGVAAWHFVTLPKKLSDEIKGKFGMMKRGWGSLRVQATIGTTQWSTSIFPDKKAGAYLLPLKADVRRKEKVATGKTVALSITICA